jgi:hypothetical protein
LTLAAHNKREGREGRWKTIGGNHKQKSEGKLIGTVREGKKEGGGSMFQPVEQANFCDWNTYDGVALKNC